ncbi:exporter of the RND superfamily [gamma proteobacterium HTCC5015]|nr:exporter of the RND superfamily [gamma proteobacterium HTCC5015]
MTRRLAQWLMRYRVWLALFSVVLSIAFSYGAQRVYFQSDYRVFFAESNPQLKAHELIQSTYTKTDNLLFVVAPGDGEVFSREALSAVAQITEAAWETPYSVRVDSLTNYQHSYADGDTLVVEDLVPDPSALDADGLAKVHDIALSEKQLLHALISEQGHVTGVNVSLELPPVADADADPSVQKEQRLKRDHAFTEVVAFGRQVRDQILEQHPDYTIHLLGVPIINETFKDEADRDSKSLIPLMYGMIIVLLAVFLRSLGSVVGVVALIALSTASSIGFLGWWGIPLNQVSAIAPIIIMTIAVCDCVHLLVIYLRQMGLGDNRLAAMETSLTINIQPIFLTSLTTAIGFMSLLFSDSPPFQELGVLCAFGVMLAMLLTLTLLPAVSVALVRRRRLSQQKNVTLMEHLANFVIARPGKVALLTLVAALALVAQMPRNQLNDDTVKYFQPSVPLRDAADFYTKHLSGFDRIAYSLSCHEAGCVNDPAFLAKVKAFGNWYAEQEGVVFVNTYVDVIEKLNKNMHGGDEDYLRLPDSQALAAQYQLLYEMSLPYGLDLNNQINFDKSAVRILLHVREALPQDLIELDDKAQAWFDEHAPEMKTHGASIPVMFAHIGMKNINSMMTGSAIALIGITITLLIALRSLRFGLLSLLPNAFPAGMALGAWGLMVGEVNLAVAVVFSVTLGIVVDDTVHFLSKYLRARREHGDSPETAVRYAFSTVGSALLVTTIVLAVGFGLLLLSRFNVNAYMGGMTAMTILIAVVFDFLFLPASLLLVERWLGRSQRDGESQEQT